MTKLGGMFNFSMIAACGPLRSMMLSAPATKFPVKVNSSARYGTYGALT